MPVQIDRAVRSYPGRLFATAWLVLAAVGGSAQAAQFHVQAQTTALAYQQRTADFQLLNRRRLHQTLGFDVYDLLGDGRNQLFWVSDLRWDSDFGIDANDEARIGGLRNHRLNIMYGYLRARNWIPWTELTAGRQLRFDPEGMLLFDGGQVTVRTPWYFALESLAGVEAKNDFGPITANTLELDGIEHDDHLTVVWGFALFVVDLRNTSGRLAYRRMDADGAVERDVVSLSAAQRLFDRLTISGDFVYDLFDAMTELATAGAAFNPRPDWTVRFDWRYRRPVFRADSIFNVFDLRPSHDLVLDVASDLLDNLTLHGSLTILLRDDDGPRKGAGGKQGLGFRAGAQWTFAPGGRLLGDIVHESGDGGQHTILDVQAEYELIARGLGFSGRFTFVDFQDALQERQKGQSYALEAGVRWRIREEASLHALVEHNFNRFLPSSTRLMVVMDLAADF